ncbi:MAG: DUF4238 domain-containing protein [Pseudomonadota bacterium]
MPTNEPVRQHWVPRVYLRSFCARPTEREQIYAYDLDSGSTFFPSIEKVAVKRHFYTLAAGTEDRSYAIENAFTQIESDVSSILSDIRTAEELPSDPGAISILVKFIATLHMRTRQGLQMIHGYREEVRAGTDSPHSKVQGPFREELLKLDEEGMRELFAKSAVIVGERIAEHLKRMHWRLLRTNDSYFITSENPVVSYHRSEVRWGIGTPGAQTLFPLSPSLLLNLSNEPIIPGQGTCDMTTRAVRGLNGLTLLAAEQFVFSHCPFDNMSDLLHECRLGNGRTFGPAR